MIAKRIWLAALAVFALLSVIDFMQTYALISGSDGAVYEANPVAAAWLEQHGWSGLAMFKLGAVAVFVGTAALLVIRRPRAGVGVMALGCLALLSVTIYSNRLLANTDRLHEIDQDIVIVENELLIPMHPEPTSSSHQ